MARSNKVAPQIDQVLDKVRELYKENPALFQQGFNIGGEQAETFHASRDYMGLILGNVAIYSDNLGREAIQRAFNLNDPSFAIGALLGAINKLPDGARFNNILD